MTTPDQSKKAQAASAYAEFDKAVKFLRENGYGDWDGTANGQEITLTGCANMMRIYLQAAQAAGREADSSAELRDKAIGQLATLLIRNKAPLDYEGMFIRAEEEYEKLKSFGWILLPLADLKAPAAPQPEGDKPTACKLCSEGMPLKKYFDGTMRHFDGLMAWHRCGDKPRE